MVLILIAAFCSLAVLAQVRSTWVQAGEGGRLQYATDARGNRRLGAAAVKNIGY